MTKELKFHGADKIRAIAAFAAYLDTLDADKEYTAKISEKKKKRSLNANAYAWVLMDKLAAKTRIEKTEIYRSYVREIGGNSALVCVQNIAVDAFCRAYEAKGLGWLTDRLPSKLPDCTNVICYYGSSTYDTAQMARLIELIVQDCKEHDIETLTPAELSAMIACDDAQDVQKCP